MIDIYKECHNHCATFLPKCIKQYFIKIGNSFYKIINKKFNSSNYWSSTTNASDTSNAWNVNFNNGNDNWNNKTNSNYVRCVRDGE